MLVWTREIFDICVQTSAGAGGVHPVVFPQVNSIPLDPLCPALSLSKEIPASLKGGLYGKHRSVGETPAGMTYTAGPVKFDRHFPQQELSA